MLAFLAAAFVASLAMNLPVMARWLERPFLVLFPLVGVSGCLLVWAGCRRRDDRLPFAGAVILFLSAFGTLAASFLPYMVPFSVTIAEAAAPMSSLSFMLWAGLFVLPLNVAYTVIVYLLFKGKVELGEGYR